MDSSEDIAPPPRGPGQRLREAREAAGISAREMADRLNWLPRHVAALEEDRFEELRGAAFVRGYLRAYARVVAVDEEEVVAAYDALQVDAKMDPDKSGNSAITGMSQKNSLSVVLGIGVAVVVVVAFWWQQGEESPTVVIPPAIQAADDAVAGESVASATIDEALPVDAADEKNTALSSPESGDESAAAEEPEMTISAVATAGTMAAAQTGAVEAGAAPVGQLSPEGLGGAVDASTVPAPATDRGEPADENPGVSSALLEFSFSGDCWLEVRDADNQLIYADLKTAGDTVRLDGKPPFRILAGDASAVALRFRGEEVQVVTRPGRDTARFTVGEL